MTSVPTHPFKDGRGLAALEQHAIERPEISVCLHLKYALGHLDGIIAIAINFQRLVWRRNTQYSKNRANLRPVIGGGRRLGDITIAFNRHSMLARNTTCHVVRRQ